jgi:hypothetical protein
MKHDAASTDVRKEPLWYNPGMTTKTLKDVLEHAATWPREDQDELAEYAREIEARRTGIYTMSDDERVAVGRGMAEADRGEFVSDELANREPALSAPQLDAYRSGLSQGCV